MTRTTELTLRQAKFVDEYVISGNAAAAARAAGYGERSAKVTACRMLTKANLKAALAAKQQAGAAQFELRREHVITAIMHAIAAAKAHGKPGIMITGWREIAKLLGFYDPETIRAERERSKPDGGSDLRYVPTSDLCRRISEDGQFRNSDGSAMTPAQIDRFYKTLSTQDLRALAEGRARVVTKIEYL
jgi:hypothetical protein